MPEYIRSLNPDTRILQKASMILKKSGLIVFPTDTNWQIVCDPFCKNAVDKLYKLKSANKTNKHFSFLCNSISQASNIAEIDSNSFRLLKRLSPGYYTFIFNAKKIIKKNLKASKFDSEVGIRISPSLFVQVFLEFYQGVLLSTNITHELLKINKDDPIYSLLIEENMPYDIQMVIEPDEIEEFGLSTILSCTGPQVEIIREGRGKYKL